MANLFLTSFLLFFLSSYSHLMAKSLCVAHRGVHKYGGRCQENSFCSVKMALNLFEDGARALEIDIHHTKDGVAILMHDNTLKRTAKNKYARMCLVNKKINQLTYPQIKKNCRLKSGDSIPILKEILPLIVKRKLILFLELKDRPSLKSKRLLKKWYASKKDLLRVISFNKGYLTQLKEDSTFHNFFQNIKMYPLHSKFPQTIDYDFTGIGLKNPTSYQVNEIQNLDLDLLMWLANTRKSLEASFLKGIDFIASDNFPLCLEVQKDY